MGPGHAQLSVLHDVVRSFWRRGQLIPTLAADRRGDLAGRNTSDSVPRKNGVLQEGPLEKAAYLTDVFPYWTLT